MIVKFGDLNVNTKHILAISDPIYDGSDALVILFVIGEKLRCLFDYRDSEEKYSVWEKGKGYLLKMTDGTMEESKTVNYNKYYRFHESVIYKDMVDAINKLSEIINNDK